jgi:release factor glutamine methyltransferase
MTLIQAVHHYARVLSSRGVADSLIEARLLISHVTQRSTVQIHTEPDQMLSPADKRYLKALIDRRLSREPYPYIVNHREFYGIDFYVDSRVLIPRPETELLVDSALAFVENNGSGRSGHPTIADIGTGCGAIAISLALSLPRSKIYATDISPQALQIAELNCRRLGVSGQITLLQGDLLDPMPESVDLIVANLPYIKNSEVDDLDPEISVFEPRIAIDGGPDGLRYISRLLDKVEQKINRSGCVLLEFGQTQQEEIDNLIRRLFRQVSFHFISDLSGTNRVVQVSFPGR